MVAVTDFYVCEREPAAGSDASARCSRSAASVVFNGNWASLRFGNRWILFGAHKEGRSFIAVVALNATIGTSLTPGELQYICADSATKMHSLCGYQNSSLRFDALLKVARRSRVRVRQLLAALQID